MRLMDLFESTFSDLSQLLIEESVMQQTVHHNPGIATLKALARNNKYHSARFVILKDGDVIAADSEHHTHHSMAPFMGAWEVRGYVQYMGDGEYAYRSMEVYSALNKDHAKLRTWQRMGIQNGNPDQSDLTEAPIRATLHTDPSNLGATVSSSTRITEPVVMLPVNKIFVFEPDTKFDEPGHAANLKMIKSAIARGKQLPAILVRKIGQKYQVIDGHHRFKAHRELNKKMIAARIIPAQHITVDDQNHASDEVNPTQREQSVLESSVELNLGGKAAKDLRVSSLIKMAKQGSLRGLVVGRNIYWWLAKNATHGEVAHKLGFDDYVDHRLTMSWENLELRVRGEPVELTSWRRSVKSCPQLIKLLQSDQLSFYAGSAGWVSGPEFQQQ